MSPRFFRFGKKKLAEMTVEARATVRPLQPGIGPNDGTATNSILPSQGNHHKKGTLYGINQSRTYNEGTEVSKGSATAESSGTPDEVPVPGLKVFRKVAEDDGLIDNSRTEVVDDLEDERPTLNLKKASEVATFQISLQSWQFGN